MDAVVYTRVSHTQRSVSVRDQERECRAVCERNNWTVRQVFSDDGVSVSRHSNAKDRPGWKALKAELREGDVLVVWEASRSYRDLGEYVALRDLCASRKVPLSYSGRVLDLTKGDDRFISGIDALVAERESDQIRERVLRGKRAAAAEGRPSGRPPWGYRSKVEPDTGRPIPAAWEFDPVEAPRVRKVVARFLKGQSQRALLKWLEETDGWAPKSTTGLQKALCNPALAGLKVHHGEVVRKGTWKPIITEDQHRRVVARVKGLKRAYGHASWPGPEPKHLLSGIAVCGHEGCGLPLRYKTFRNRSPAYVCPAGHCCRTAVAMDLEVEDELFEKLPKINPARYRSDDPAADRAQAQIDEIKEELDGWIAAAGRREVTREAFVKIEKDLRNRMAMLQPETNERLVEGGRIDFETLQKRWPRLSIRQRRDIVRALLTITVMPFEREVIEECGNGCGRTNIYARGLCKPCYLKAWRGRIPMPPLLEPGAGRVIIEPI